MSNYKVAGLALGAVLSVSLAACGQPETAAPAVDKAGIAAVIKGDVHLLVEQFNARDAEKAVSHDGPDYVGMFHGMPNVKGPAEDLVVTKQQVADPAANVAVSDEIVDVAAAGDMAVYRATYTFTFTDAATKQPTTERGNWVMGYKVQPDGSWKLAWGVVSDTGRASPVAPTAAGPVAAKPD